MTIINDYELCEDCDGEGTYLYDTGYDYSYKAGTYSYIAECSTCNGSGRIYEEDDDEEE